MCPFRNNSIVIISGLLSCVLFLAIEQRKIETEYYGSCVHLISTQLVAIQTIEKMYRSIFNCLKELFLGKINYYQ